MIDTITFNCNLLIDLPRIEQLQMFFKTRKSNSSIQSRGAYMVRTSKWTFDLLGLRIFSTKQSYLTKIECELPCLLHGHNGRLIRSQLELDKALEVLKKLLQFISPVDVHGERISLDLGNICRIDLVWQYDLPVQTLREVLQYAKHPRIQNGADLYANGNTTFNGKSLRVNIYDKLNKVKGCHLSPSSAQNACRIECQIRSKKYVADRFGVSSEEGLRSTTFDCAYGVFRDLILGFSHLRSSVAANTHGISNFLAAEALRDAAIIDRYIKHTGVSKRTASDLKYNVTSAKLKKFNMADLCPPASPPPPVDVINPKLEADFQSFMDNHGDVLGLL